ncbi:Sec63 Brl domain-domain-containing protein [Phakopsora pachyrhizi]|uniref:RNA helicase n=1 Tax=Phakopsora pachyrhizi TaxID=170000 RepID=A0AAV0ALU7_PHAPC|nr:Sec63 Brl domain-domain-containing protein [Phakopsora pachyrhizi]
MAPKNRDFSGYQYAAMSSLVLTADRSKIPRRDNEPTGEPETLVGRIDPRSMGSRAFKESVHIKRDISKKKTKHAVHADERPKKVSEINSRRYGDVIEAIQEIEGLNYKPRTSETRSIYELFLSSAQAILGDQPNDITRSAADMAIETLKNDNDYPKDLDKKRSIEEFLGAISNEKFNELSNLAKKLTDYGDDEQVQQGANEGEDGEGKTRANELNDDNNGVAVVFEDDEDEDDSDADEFEIRDDEDSEDEDEDEDEEKERDGDPDPQVDEAGELITIGPDSNNATTSASKSKKGKDELTIYDIDGFWLQRLIGNHFPDPIEAESKTKEAINLLSAENSSLRDLENSLVDLFNYDKFELVSILTKNRDIIVWGTRWSRSDEDEKVNLAVVMREKGVGWIVKALTTGRGINNHQLQATVDSNRMDVDSEQKPEVFPKKANFAPNSFLPNPKKVLDLNSMKFNQGSRTMTNKKCKLPEGSHKVQPTGKGYEEIHVPPPEKAIAKGDDLIKILELPDWCREAFKGATTLNRVQSKTFPIAFSQDDPILLCAPTGAGKTNVAMLTILNEISKHRSEATGEIDYSAFKIVYVAPMKALVQEMVGNFSSRLKYLGIQVGELTGDRQMTKDQISMTQIIVTTPEKWDVITRKSTDTSYTNLVGLIIIDEIHLLHDERGPVLEALVARTIRRMEQNHEYVRLVGLSATLPNYTDVAKFLRVNPKKGLFFFDSSYRPCPLKLEFIGITEKKAVKRLQLTNEICYDKVINQLENKQQIIIFVHSRKETGRTAKQLKETAIEREEIDKFMSGGLATREILMETCENVRNQELKDILQFGIGIHHAGLERVDRGLVEELFADGHLQVLVSTATLAWGVNLPAHAVIIKGTQIYNPEKGRWVELSPQDVLQMLGRAGRPQYDTMGEGIIITNHSELQFHLSIVTSQLPIESQLVSKLADNLNAEIVLGTIRNRDEAAQWLGYTYWYQRALNNPSLYGIQYEPEDPLLLQKRSDIVHTAFCILEKSGLIKYDRRSGVITSTELGKIASHYYVTNTSMATYNQHLRPTMTLIELFRVFAASDEFKFVPTRPEEKQELAKLLEKVPIPIKESVDDPSAKINVLLQAYISRLTLEGFALMADMVYVTQSAGRILRALFEICLKRGWARLTHQALDLCKMVEKRMWTSMTPLRQFPSCSSDIIRRAERKDFPWSRFFDLEPPELGELMGNPKLGKTIHKFVHQFPKLELQALVQPITRSLLRVELTITPDFMWEESVHGTAEIFWIMVEDVDGELLLFSDQFLLRQRYCTEEHFVTFYVPMIDPLPPNYFISVVADRWLHAGTRLPLSFKHLILPEKFSPPTPLLDLQPLPVAALHQKSYESIYVKQGLKNFNKIQTQVFQALYTTNENVLICSPTGSGKTICAEFALLRLWSQPGWHRCVCIEPYQEVVNSRVKEWRQKFGQLGKVIEPLTGELTRDVEITASDGSKPGQGRIDVIICTPTQWDLVSRRWKQRKMVERTALLIADEIHLIGSEIGPTYEVIVSRTRYVTAQSEISKTRIVALGCPLANARDLGDWMGATTQTIFNFSPGSRPLPLEVHLQSFNVPHFPSLMIQMAKPAYLSILEYAHEKPVIVFVPSRKQCRLTASDLSIYALSDEDPQRFLNIEKEDLVPHLAKISDENLRETLESGIGYYHEAMSNSDKLIVQKLFEAGAIQIVVASKDTAWCIPMTSYMVIIMGVQNYEGKEHRYVDYPFTDILQMMGRACRPTEDTVSRCVLMCQQVRKEFFKKFLNEGIPIESHLHLSLHDHFNAEIVAKTIENKQDAVDWCTWQWFYRRLVANPNYYNMQATDHRHLSDHLSELVETTLSDLQNSNCIAIEDEMDTTPLPLGIVAAYYNINYITADVFSMSLTEKTKLKGILEIISAAQEFESVPLRHGEDSLLKKVYDRVPVKVAKADYLSPHFKTNVLVQAHFSRLTLPSDLMLDQAEILRKVPNLISAAVDVLSSQECLNTTIAMEFFQMIVQAVWNHDSPLKQIPGFNSEVIQRCIAAGVTQVTDIMELENDQRNELLKMDKKQMAKVAQFVNAHPVIEMGYEIEDEDSLTANTPITLKVSLTTDEEDDEDESKTPVAGNIVIAPFFPTTKQDCWWLIVEDPKNKKLLGLKKVTGSTPLPTKIEFTVLTAGKHELKLDLISDSYIGVDQELKLELNVGEGDDDDSDEDSDEDEEMEDGEA